ncbi:DNA-binding helix-turn-helix protein [Bacteroidales bacterium KA00251]|nr:DNA-binding helix-turn-helix protein [Bacteroidales bacterium KA00251]
MEIFAIFVPEIKRVMREKKLLERLYKLRTERQIPSQELARILGVEPPMYSRMERGSRNIKVEHLKKIAEFYHVDCDELHALWVADKLSEFAQGLPQEVFEQAISILNRERDKDNGEGQ